MVGRKSCLAIFTKFVFCTVLTVTFLHFVNWFQDGVKAETVCDVSVSVDEFSCTGQKATPDKYEGQISVPCAWDGFQCVSTVGVCSSNDTCSGTTCSSSPVNCGSTGSTGGVCSSSCKQGTSCSGAYEGGSGCSNCKSNQVCCRNKNYPDCGSGGSGSGQTCPDGTHFDPSKANSTDSTCVWAELCTGYRWETLAGRCRDGSQQDPPKPDSYWCNPSPSVCIVDALPATITLPNITINGVGGVSNVVPVINPANGFTASAVMTFSVVSNPSIAELSPLTDTPAFRTVATGLSIGSTTYKATATDKNGML